MIRALSPNIIAIDSPVSLSLLFCVFRRKEDIPGELRLRSLHYRRVTTYLSPDWQTGIDGAKSAFHGAHFVSYERALDAPRNQP